MSVKKVFDSKSDLQSYSRCQVIDQIRFPISLPLQLCCYLVLLPRHYQLFLKILRGHVTLIHSLLSEIIYYACSSTHQYQFALQLEVPSFTHSKYVTGTPKNRISNVMLTTTSTLSGVVCYRLRLAVLNQHTKLKSMSNCPLVTKIGQAT